MGVIRLAGFGLLLIASTAMAQSGSATLYSPNKYVNEKRNFCLNFKTGTNQTPGNSCDLGYGYLYARDDGTPKIDPVFVKAVVGHMYVAHVVNEQNDFYALFRVDALERGDYCVVSWKVIDPPRVAAKLGSQ